MNRCSQQVKCGPPATAQIVFANESASRGPGVGQQSISVMAPPSADAAACFRDIRKNSGVSL